MDAGTLLGLIFVVVRVAIMIGLLYYVVVTVLRERRGKDE